METNDYYVYVYIDPRNYREFYYGKGRGSRKFAHLNDDSDTEKAKTIRDILAEGLDPIVRVVASGLTESEALLIEKTLIWKLGKTLTNISSGHFSEKFRPQNTMHKNIPGFDFQNQICYVNVGEGRHRRWDDCLKLGFLAAGQGAKWRDQLLRLNVGDVVVAYLKRKGYVGIGSVVERACPIKDFYLDGKLINQANLTAERAFENSDNPDLSEYLVKVAWHKAVSREDAKWMPNNGLFSSQLVTASLANQPETIEFIEKEFEIEINSLAA